LGNPIYWHLSSALQPSAASTFLTPAEKAAYASFRFDARRKSWLAGRYTAKVLVAKVHGGQFALNQIEIRNDELGAPRAFHATQPIPGGLSISHSGDWSAAAYAPAGLQVGIDIEHITQRSAEFIKDYFTENEAFLIFAGNGNTIHPKWEQVARSPVENATLIWSAKEALLKAMGIGLRMDTRQVKVLSIADAGQNNAGGWKRLDLSCSQVSLTIDAYWQKVDGYMLTLAVLREGDARVTLTQVN
jgi:4'-phosphopantetheinyl transferase